jgi:hypothetical protein
MKTRLLASRGFSEWTCSMALRSLLKMPCWNFGLRAWRMEWIRVSSRVSRSRWKTSQLAEESDLEVRVGAGEVRTGRRRLMRTRPCCKNFIAMDEDEDFDRQIWWGRRW